MEIRPLEKSDYDRGYKTLLNVLAPSDKLDRQWFEDIVSSLDTRHQIWVIVREDTIIAGITLWVERKMIRHGSTVLHIEDVMVLPSQQKQGHGRRLMQKAWEIADLEKCYKIVLDCSEENVPFYEACNLQRHQVQMAWYRV
jgi:glucosamine-phosphate N-acetyltransferase